MVNSLQQKVWNRLRKTDSSSSASKGPPVDAKRQQSGQTALHAAAGGGHGEVVRLLLEHGSDARIEDNERNTPLHAAAAHGHGLCVKMLLCVHVHVA